MSGSWKGGSTRRWRRVRSLTYATQGRRCVLRLSGCTDWADEVHHTQGKAVTGDDPRHVVPACAHCNGKAGDPAAAARVDPRPRPRTRW